jgi:hypothetical protein
MPYLVESSARHYKWMTYLVVSSDRHNDKW